MLKNIWMTLALAVTVGSLGGLTGCQADNQVPAQTPVIQQAAVQKPAAGEAVIPVPASQEAVKAYHWSGLIHENYPITVNLEEKDSILQGSLVYTNTAAQTPIRLLGRVIHYTDGQEAFSFAEMAANGEHTGDVDGNVTAAGGFEGHWRAPSIVTNKNGSYVYIEGNRYTVSLSNHSMDTPPVFSWDSTAADCLGTYRYSYGENSGGGTLKLFKRDGKLMCSISSNTAAPAFNMAIVTDKECTVRDGRIICRLDTGKNSAAPHVFEILPFRDFAVVRFVSGAWNGYFGMGATIEGQYLKID